MEEFDYEEVVKATNSFSPSNLIGRGSHGSVYRASFLGSNGDGRQTALVAAVKRLSHVREDTSKKLSNEIYILSSLSPHPHVVKIIGSSTGLGHGSEEAMGARYDHRLPFLVMEFMPNGSLHDLIHKSPNSLPGWPARFQIALQVARALESLHGMVPPVIHRDVKSTNVLFDSEWNAKLSDFGLAVTEDHSTSPAGTIGYIDPAYTCPSKLSTKNDIFSYGVLMLEILSGRKAVDVSKQPSSIVNWATSLVKRRKPMNIPDSRVPFPKPLEGKLRRMLCIATRCLSPKESSRPSARELVVELERLRLAKVITQVPLWMNPLRNIILTRQRRQRVAKECRNRGSNDVRMVEFTNPRLSLREVLADITLEENKN